MGKKFTCSECNSSYFYYKNLRKHARKAHPDKISDIAPALKTKKTFQYKCGHCDKQFNHFYNFRYHERQVHNLENGVAFNGQKYKKLKCPLCDDTFPLKKKLYYHIECAHCLNINLDKIRFDSFEQFLKWKENTEKVTLSRYIKEHGSKRERVGNVIKHYFICHRSGHYVPEGKGRRKLKSQGSQKINGTCPASILVNETEHGECNVQYISTHVGHNADIDHLNLTPTERCNIAAEIANNIPFQTILEKAHNSVSDSELSRIKLLKKKDLYNIKSSFNLHSKQLSNKKSVLIKDNLSSLLDKLNENNDIGVLFCKLQGTLHERHPELKSDDFLIIIMSNSQSEILMKYGTDFICIDRTHDLNSYGYELISLFTICSNKQGYPCAFLIANRCDQSTLSIFFEYIKSQTGKLSTKIFMSDREEYFLNTWTLKMNEPTMKLYCSWLLEKEWRENILKIKNTNKQNDMYKTIITLMQEQIDVAFEIKLQIAIEHFSHDPDTAEFGKYFTENFSKNINCWAFCYRLNSIVSINPVIERLHKSIKYIYSQGKNSKQLDKAIYSLVSLSDKVTNSIVSINENKLKSLTKEIQARHRASLKLVTDLLTEEENGWKIQSTTDLKEVYYIKNNISHCNCQLICEECKTCIHKYICSCIDCDVKLNMCKHIHLICHYLNSEQNNCNNSERVIEAVITDDSFTIPIESEVVISETGEILVQLRENECTQVTNVLNLKSNCNSVPDESEKEKVKQDFIELVDNISSESEFEIIKEHVTSLKDILNALQSQTICINTDEPGEDDDQKTIIMHEDSKRVITESNIFPLKKIKTTHGTILKTSDLDNFKNITMTLLS
ncbi:uncharacterized protein LOC142326071 [Lycorma delicatula]|uniref:uncharacterized protein LOC142326071 n=1 Tax=Lycorma delicatula TaxID=130591 RepID=UPI003F50D7B9